MSSGSIAAEKHRIALKYSLIAGLQLSLPQDLGNVGYSFRKLTSRLTFKHFCCDAQKCVNHSA